MSRPRDPGDHRSPVAVGDLRLPDALAGQPVEWAVIERVATGGGAVRWRAVPADTWTGLVGSADVAVTGDDAARLGPLVLRCAWVVELQQALLEAGPCTGRLGEDTVERARERLERLAAGCPPTGVSVTEVDRNPEYEDWVETALAPAHRAAQRLAAGTETATAHRLVSAETAPGHLLPGPGPFTRLVPAALAALLAVAVVVGGLVLWQLGAVDDLKEREASLRARIESLEGAVERGEASLAEVRDERQRLQERLADVGERLEREESRTRELQARLERPAGPSTRVAVQMLDTAGTVRGEPEPVEVEPWVERLVLLFALPPREATGTVYRLELIDEASGETVSTSDQARWSRDTEAITLDVSRSDLPDGLYRVRIWGDGADPALDEPLREVRFEVSSVPAG